MSSPEEVWVNLTKRQGIVLPKEAASSFAALKPVTIEFLTRGNGEWELSGDINIGHPAGSILERKRIGKTFRNAEDAIPVVYNKSGMREWDAEHGSARLREMKFEDSITIALISDNFPVIDYFHYVSEDMVAAAMDSKQHSSDGIYYFYLTRL